MTPDFDREMSRFVVKALLAITAGVTLFGAAIIAGVVLFGAAAWAG